MPKQAKNNPTPQTKAQNKASVERDRAFLREGKALVAQVNDGKPAADDPRRGGA